MEKKILKLSEVSKSYLLDSGEKLDILRGVSFELGLGESLAILGPSGCGKSTLLSCMAALLDFDSGEIQLADQKLSELSEVAKARVRAEQIGFVFQSFQLLASLTVLENVTLPLELLGRNLSDAKKEAKQLLANLGLEGRLAHYPWQLSGGEQQRVALCRAFIHKPKILFADEPTGNLDEKTGAEVVRQLFALQQNYGTSLVIVTHDEELAKLAQRRVRMREGQISSEE